PDRHEPPLFSMTMLRGGGCYQSCPAARSRYGERPESALSGRSCSRLAGSGFGPEADLDKSKDGWSSGAGGSLTGSVFGTAFVGRCSSWERIWCGAKDCRHARLKRSEERRVG